MTGIQNRRSALTVRHRAHALILGHALIAYSIAALLVKSFILLGYITRSPYLVPDVPLAFRSWTIYLRVYFCWAVMVTAPALLLKNSARDWTLTILNAIVSLMFVFDLWYFRGLNGFTSFYHLRELGNLRHMSGAVLSLIHPADFLFFADVVLLFFYLAFRKKRQTPRSVPVFLALLALSVGLVIEMTTIEIDEDPLFTTRWIPAETIAALSPIGYHLYDLYSFCFGQGRLELSAKERAEIRAWFDQKKEHLPPNQYSGLFRGCNLILLQCESLENFVIEKKIGDQEITPTLNRLVARSLYFTNYMEQVGDGTSIDSEYMVNTSVYPLRTSTAALRYPHNAYRSLPRLLESRGYWTADLHPDPGSYWNWEELMLNLGMNQCLDAKSFNQDELIGLGLSDGSFLRQAAPDLAGLRQPFYAYLITLTNHGPFDLPQPLRELRLDRQLEHSEIGAYLESVHYMDKQIGIFLARLDAAGLLEHTLVGIFGDHCGIHKFYEDALERLPDGTQEWMDNGKRIPLLLYHKHQRGKRIDELGGQIDALPTIASLMGLEEAKVEETAMGRNLLNTHKNFVVVGDGAFLSAQGSESERQHALKGIEIAEKIVRSDYFKGKEF